MCGIFTVIPKKNYTINLSKCISSLNKLKRRGPDWSFHKIINNVFFGQTVLSMTGGKKKNISNHLSKSKNFFLSYNGEIYNYQNLNENYTKNIFSKNLTDTNILINLFDKCNYDEINKLLDGMYAYVVSDKKKKKIYISRDPQGEKSLFKFEDINKIIISSEIDPILDYTGQKIIDPEILSTYFNSRHFIQFDKTIYKNIKIIEPGDLLEIDLKKNSTRKINNLSIMSYISEKDYIRNLKRSENDLLDELDFLLKKNLLEMIPKNRSFASIVSGGIDSSLISFYLSEISNPKRFISINHIGKDFISNKIYKFNKFFKKKILSINVNEKKYLKNLKISTRICSGPINSHDFVGKLILAEETKKNNCKALFGGDGADELFGGYETYSQKIKDENKNFSNYTKIINESFFDAKNEFKYFKDKLEKNWKKSLISYKFVKNKVERNRLAMMLTDTTAQLPSVGLRGSDLMSMYYSVESRSVFLRKEILKFSLNLPIKHKINFSNKNNIITKVLLKKLFIKKFNKNLVFRKQGFSGFPNEIGKYLGFYKDFAIHKYFNFFNKNIKNKSSSFMWKIFNTEYFLKFYEKNIVNFK
jgi:asparagine synthase (glutamine-hydrolysing)